MGRDSLTAEQLIRLIDGRYYELSHDKAQAEYVLIKKMCREWINRKKEET